VDYQALYRKYRPQRFADIVGQEHVTLTLAREVQGGRVAHAYLFTGPRGTGKTTTARIIAKSLNCPDRGPDGEPCNVCPSCVAITEGISLDVIELDAASHNKVEDVREIRANVGTVASVGGARRVYILDEAHMLSRAAANALLKTLEEPPEHVHFVLATTEPYKLPDTIRSRAQRFDFRPIGSDSLHGHLERIAKAEGFKASREGLALVVRHARGSARDALGLLEQVTALNAGKVDPAGVARALGLAPGDAFRTLAAAIADHDAPAALTLMAGIASSGADLRRFVADGLEYFRGVFLAQYAPRLEEVVDEPSDVIDEWRAEARRLEPTDVLRTIDQLGEALAALREGREERLVVELALLRLTRPETATDLASLLARMDRLEERVRRSLDVQGGEPSRSPRPRTPAPEPPPEPAALPEASPEPAEAPAGEPEAGPASGAAAPETATGEPGGAVVPPREAAEVDLPAVETIWPALVARVRELAGPRRHALLRETRPAAVEDGKLVIEVPGHLPFHLAQLREDDRLNAVVDSAAADLLGAAVGIVYRSGAAAEPAAAASESRPDRAPDKDSLLEEGSDTLDPAELLRDLLGGEIVED
jgi:DNA polymerase-3 subunit gamma/tau